MEDVTLFEDQVILKLADKGFSLELSSKLQRLVMVGFPRGPSSPDAYVALVKFHYILL